MMIIIIMILLLLLIIIIIIIKEKKGALPTAGPITASRQNRGRRAGSGGKLVVCGSAAISRRVDQSAVTSVV